METRGLQGWAADPFRLHAERYFSGGHPTKLVRDGNAEAFDDPPSDSFFPVPPAEPDRRSYTPASRPVGTRPLSPARGNPRPAAGPPRSVRSTYDPAASLPAPYGPGPASTPAPISSAYAQSVPDAGAEPGPSRRPRRGLLLAGAAGVVAVAVIASIILVHKSPSTGTSLGPGASSASPASFVIQSAHHTLAERAADMTLTGTWSANGQKAAVHATGVTDFSHDASAFDLHLNSPLGAVEEKTKLVNGSEFIALTVDGRNLAGPAGRTWVQVPVQQSAAAEVAGSDPVASLTVLEQQGSPVQAIGAKVIGGVSCTGYTVKPSKLILISVAKAEQADLGLPQASTDQEVRQIEKMPQPSMTVWVDGQDLVREMSLDVPANVAGTVGAADMVVDFSHFGAPVSVTAPAASDTTSYASFLKSLGKSPAS